MNHDQPSSDDLAFGEIKFFSPGSRVNRLRYWAHSMLMTIPFCILIGISAALATKVSPIFFVIGVVGYIGMIAFSFILMIQRLHDLNKSGWLSLLALVPFANLYLAILLIFFAGTPGRNDYGLPTPPNKTWHWILALVGPILVFIGVTAAVAIPAYQQYKIRAQENAFDSSSTSLDASDEATDELTGEDEEAVEGAEATESEEADENESPDDSTVVEEKTEDTSSSESSETPKAPK